MDYVAEDHNLDKRKTLRLSAYPAMEKALYTWFVQEKAKEVQIPLYSIMPNNKNKESVNFNYETNEKLNTDAGYDEAIVLNDITNKDINCNNVKCSLEVPIGELQAQEAITNKKIDDLYSFDDYESSENSNETIEDCLNQLVSSGSEYIPSETEDTRTSIISSSSVSQDTSSEIYLPVPVNETRKKITILSDIRLDTSRTSKAVPPSSDTLQTEKNITRPVKTSKKMDAEYFVCTYCLGQYTKKLLFEHVKKCESRPENTQHSKKCLTNSQTFMALINSKNSNFLKSTRVKNEVFNIMRPDDISAVVKNDPLICLYGEALLSKHKRQQIVTVVSNKMREMGRLLIALNTTQNLNGLFDALKPDMFQHLLCATKQISGYDESTKRFKSPSLAMHMGTNLKIVCDVAYRLVMEKRNIPGIQNYDNAIRRSEIKDLRKLVEGHWCNELSSLALKDLKEKHWEKPLQLPLTSDLQLFNNYIDALADESLTRLENSNNNKIYYKQLTQCILAKTVLFNRKRVGDVQYLKIETYNKSYSTVNPECFHQALTEVKKIISKNHKRVITGGKGSKPVPILFSKQT
ncbi:hypothetical protein MML48_9g00013103 [Holotrichia oblita]|uniref:Uncharacterized protein n=1 Tax=Holotrichia oblita TaxID=644536 RepID=A0ACB9SLL6_HOLOL|nr:hypothetical protein MML48_9g00013103 [Holotrichia oblita]